MTLKDLQSAVTRLLARSDGELKSEVATLQATVSGTVATLTDQLAAATAEITKLNETSQQLDAELAAARLSLASFASLNEAVTDACMGARVLTLPEGSPADQRAAALALPLADKFASYQGALNAAFARASLPQAAIPVPPAPQAGASSDLWAQYAALEQPAARTAFYRAHKAAMDASFRAQP